MHYVQSYVLNKTINSHYEYVSFQNESLYEIFNNYREIYLIMDDNVNTNIWINLTNIDRSNIDLGTPFNTWVLTISSLQLNIINPLDISIKYPVYQDAIFSGYKYNLAIAGFHDYDESKIQTKNRYKDIRITRPQTNTDLSLLHRKAIITVNGVIHQTDTDGTNLWVLDATDNLLKRGNNHVGITSFAAICDINKIKMNNIIIEKDGNTPLYEKLIIRLPDDANDNHQLLLSLFGYLTLQENNTFYKIGERAYILELNKTPYIERIYELYLYMDIAKKLELTVSTTNDTIFNYDELISDEVILKLMNLSQTFVMTVPVVKIISEKFYLRKTNLPGMFQTQLEPKNPLIVGYGKMSEYWKTKYDNTWEVIVSDYVNEKFILSYLPEDKINLVNRHRLPKNTYDVSRAFFLELGVVF